MNSTRETPEAVHAALSDARKLVELGVPVVCGPLDRDGNPSGPSWNGWEKTRPNTRPVDRWQPGQALAAVVGGKFDVLDVDPRAGGMESLQRLSEDLGDNGPDEYWRVRTSSGGRHIWIGKLGIGRSIHFMPGLDLLGKPSLAFLPPTVRPSKDASNLGERVAYRALTDLDAPVGHDFTGGHLRDYITECLAKRSGGNGSARVELSALEQGCLEAGNGGQRDALLALAMELQRTYRDDEYVLWRLMKVRDQMECFVKRRPWSDKDLAGLLITGDRRPIADADESEAAILASMGNGSGPMVARATGGLKPLSSVTREKIRWLWYRYLAFGDASLIDAHAGIGKSLTSVDIAARATTGRGMPCAEEVLSGALNVLMLAPEDRASVILARVEAAGGDPGKILIPDGIEVKRVPGKKGKDNQKRAYLGGHLITFPSSTEQFHNWIKQYKIGLVIIDPIAAFLDPDILPGVDASVRQALEPFVTVLGMEGCAAWLIRHFNKDSKQQASLRGGGSVAFGAVARTHMVAGEMPEDLPTEATAGIALVKTNNIRRKKGVALGYVIEDSDIEADDVGTMVPVVRWIGEVACDAEELAGKSRRGPAPTAQPEWREFLDGLFGDKDKWLVSEIKQRAEDAGLHWDNKVYDKVVDRMGVYKVSEGKPGGGKNHYWTTQKPRVGRYRREN